MRSFVMLTFGLAVALAPASALAQTAPATQPPATQQPPAGQQAARNDGVREIAVRLDHDASLPVVLSRSCTSSHPGVERVRSRSPRRR